MFRQCDGRELAPKNNSQSHNLVVEQWDDSNRKKNIRLVFGAAPHKSAHIV